jgi:hypothetical protein
VLSASFRTRTPLEERIAAVTNADAIEHQLLDVQEPKELEPSGRVPMTWLAGQKIATFRITDAEAEFVDVVNPYFLATYGLNSRVRRAIERHLGEEYDLDAGTVMLNLQHGRPVTQALAAVLWGEEPPPSGIRYLSRLDLGEECWAVFDRTEVEFTGATPLDPTNSEHRMALQQAAEVLRLALPPVWEE